MTFHWIPARNGKVAEDALNADLRKLRVVSLERHFCSLPPDPGWAICIEHAEGDTAASGRGGSGAKIDYRETLDADTFRIYSALREWRKAEGANEGVPIYAVMSNEQLAEVARRRCSNLAEIEGIAGVTPAQAKKRGPGLLKALAAAITQGPVEKARES